MKKRIFACLWAACLSAILLLMPLAHAVESFLPPEPSAMVPTPPAPLKGHVQVLEDHYALQAGDKLNISVYSAPEYDKNELEVRPDGMMTLQPFGEMQAAGLTIGELKYQIEERLRHYLKKPEVSISVSQFHPAIVYVLGAVRKPGAYEVHGNIDQPDSANAMLSRSRLTVTNLIANAGGVMQTANVADVVIKHNHSGVEQHVDLVKLLKEGDISQDVLLTSGDTIMVPSQSAPMDPATLALVSKSSVSPDMITVRVIGKVTNPGVYPIPAQNAGINSAIASARGYMIEARNHHIRVLRADSEGRLQSLAVNARDIDFPLQENDVVMVDERGVPILGRGIDYTTRALLPFVSMGTFANAVMDLIHPGRRFPVRAAGTVNN